MKAIGVVTKTDGDFATVVSRRSSACSACHSCEAKGACHAELIFGSQTEDVSVSAFNSVNAKVGDKVELESSTKETLFASFAFFILPVVFTVVFFFLTKSFLGMFDGFPLILIAVFLLSFMFIGKFLNSVFKNRQTILIVKVLEESKEHFEAE